MAAFGLRVVHMALRVGARDMQNQKGVYRCKNRYNIDYALPYGFFTGYKAHSAV